MQKTLVILKPSCVERGIIGEVISRFEKKGLQLVGTKMMQLTDEMLEVHYAHLVGKPYFGRVKESMKASPVIIQCWRGVEAIQVVRNLVGATNGREALAGTIRGDYSMSSQENIVHASDSPESAEAELKHFFSENEIFDFGTPRIPFLYAHDEY